MYKKMPVSFWLGLSLLSAPMGALAADTCSESLVRVQNTQIHQMYDSREDRCYISVTSRISTDLTYRSFLFSNEGLFMVFESYGSGSDRDTTGAREFTLMPMAQRYPSYEVLADGTLKVNHTSGEVFTFETAKVQLASISHAEITVKESIKPANRGGVEFVKINRGILHDGGFKVGSSATGNPSGYSQLRDSSDNNCRVQNKELYSYDSNGDNRWNYLDPMQLKKFLAKRCPKLKY